MITTTSVAAVPRPAVPYMAIPLGYNWYFFTPSTYFVFERGEDSIWRWHYHDSVHTQLSLFTAGVSHNAQLKLWGSLSFAAHHRASFSDLVWERCWWKQEPGLNSCFCPFLRADTLDTVYKPLLNIRHSSLPLMVPIQKRASGRRIALHLILMPTKMYCASSAVSTTLLYTFYNTHWLLQSKMCCTASSVSTTFPGRNHSQSWPSSGTTTAERGGLQPSKQDEGACDTASRLMCQCSENISAIITSAFWSSRVSKFTEAVAHLAALLHRTPSVFFREHLF